MSSVLENLHQHEAVIPYVSYIIYICSGKDKEQLQWSKSFFKIRNNKSAFRMYEAELTVASLSFFRNVFLK